MKSSVKFNLAEAVHRFSLETPEALAVASEGMGLTYSNLARRARAVAALLGQSPDFRRENSQLPRVAILASRSIDACVAVLGANWAGATYVPISLKTPEDRIAALLSRYSFSALIADSQGSKLITERVAAACPPLVILPGADRHDVLAVSPNLEKRDLHDLDEPQASMPPVPVKASHLAYIIFTSGTTGEPKGVMISCGAIRHYIETVTEDFGFCARDRSLGLCDLSFDPSLYEMYVPWEVGASFHVLPANRVMNAVKYVKEAGITAWNLVPSLAGMLKQVKALKPGSMPGLRLTTFGGEQLPLSTVEAWQSAAPNSVIVNAYGPTEATIACLAYRLDPSVSLAFNRDIVPIGTCLPGTEAAIMRESRTLAGPNEPGELVIFGEQLAEGYLDAPGLTAAKFPTFEGRRCYLTGDLAVQDAEGMFHHLGRIDNQVKVLGHRIELEDVDTHLRAVSGSELVATVAWPIVNGAAQGLIAFIGASAVDQASLTAQLKCRLPSYMVPGKIVAVDKMPLNSNSKVDRGALLNLLVRETPV